MHGDRVEVGVLATIGQLAAGAIAREKARIASRFDSLACDKCHAAIQGDDREALLGRVMLAPVPRTVSDRYAPRFRAQARELHEQFWLTRQGPPELA